MTENTSTSAPIQAVTEVDASTDGATRAALPASDEMGDASTAPAIVDVVGMPYPDDSRIKRAAGWYSYLNGTLNLLGASSQLDELLLLTTDEGMPRATKAKIYAGRGFAGALLDESLSR